MPAASAAMAKPESAVGPPRSVPKISLPEESALTIKASEQGMGEGKPLQTPPPLVVWAAPGVTLNVPELEPIE